MDAADILELRDKKFIEYFSRKEFLECIERVFGKHAKDNILDMTKIALERRIIKERKIQFVKG